MPIDLDKYKGVIKMVVAKYPGADPALITDEILKSIEIAQAIAGEIPEPTRNVSVNMLSPYKLEEPPPLKETPRRATLLSVVPPVAGAGESSQESEDDVDYYESKPGKGDGANRLQVIIQNMLPASIQVQIPGIEKPLTLVRGVGSPGIRFVYINYTMPGDTMGCRYTVMTSQKHIDTDVILADIVSQAEAFYSAEKRTLVPHAPKLDLMPTSQDLDEVMKRDRQRLNPHNPMAELSQDEAKLASEDAKAFQSARESNPRWRE